MNQMWKRVMSLALSGVLLMGSLPMQAWATEGTNPPENQSQPEPQSTGSDTVLINGAAVRTGDAAIVYENGVLTLKNANITVEDDKYGIEASTALTIMLEGKNTITTKTGEAIFAASDLTITGEGSLVVTSDNATAVYKRS